MIRRLLRRFRRHVARRQAEKRWTDALSDPSTKRALDEGLADFAAGRVRPWKSRRHGWRGGPYCRTWER